MDKTLMMFLRFTYSLLFILCGLFSTTLMADSTFSGNSGKSLAAETVDFLPVEQAYQADLLFSKGQWLVIWQMAEHYFLYRHGFKNEWLSEGNATSITASIPDGIKKTDEYFGNVEIYYQQIMIPLEIPPAGNAGTLLLKTNSQGCADAGLCYPPYSVYFSVDTKAHKATAISAVQYQEALTNSPTTINTGNTNEQALGWILLSALLGGLILNLMPCVLPVLSIKALQLARQPNMAQARKESLTYLAGVIISFVAMAAVMLALRASGSAIGWGFQLQNPGFVAGLVVLFFILGLGMSGLIHIGHRWMGIGQSLSSKSGLSGSFFTGVLAVVVASPCTAPFMSAALGYALTQPDLVALLIFATLGLGMALPLTLFSFIPAASRLLPKPGLWMERLKQFFAFPLYATAIWLLWVFGKQTSMESMAMLLLSCLMIALLFWCFQSPRLFSRIFGLTVLAAVMALTFNLATEKHTGSPSTAHETFSEKRLATLLQQGTPVFIDLTADWCITCIANEKSTLETARIQQAFKDAGITYMVGDWTDYNPEITALLARYQRSGIPLYLLFSGKPDTPALILPQILTPAIVLEHIDRIESVY